MNNLLSWDSNPDSMCSCAHILRVHTFSCYQNIQVTTTFNGPFAMIPAAPAYTEWKCEYCDCEEFKIDNLRFLEKKYEESQG
jgi:hypothetical protein